MTFSLEDKKNVGRIEKIKIRGPEKASFATTAT